MKSAPKNIHEMVDGLLEYLTESEIRVLAKPYTGGGRFNFMCPEIIAELDRRAAAKKPWWRRIFK
jgi:hypothetical protein